MCTIHRLAITLLVVILSALPCAPASAHETDQYSLPLDREFADLGDWLDAAHCRVIESVATELNEQIALALDEPDSPQRRETLDFFHAPTTVADRVHLRFRDAFTEVLDAEAVVRSSWAKKSFPGKYTVWGTDGWIYDEMHFPLDPRRIVMSFPASTLKAYGVYFGTDKLTHFHHMGHFYFRAYTHKRQEGMTEERAVAWTVHHYATGGIFAESALLGGITTGVYSNADLVSNYSGYKFYRNLTEPVSIKGKVCPPLLVRRGEFWALNLHVRPESGWFGAFVSDHWNEALNPSIYDENLTRAAHVVIAERAERIVRFYTIRDGRPADPAYYDNLAQELTTYYGEDYGHEGGPSEIITLGNLCIPELAHRGVLAQVLADAQTPAPTPAPAPAESSVARATTSGHGLGSSAAAPPDDAPRR